MATKNKTTVHLSDEAKDHLMELKKQLMGITSMSAAIEYIVNDYVRMKQELEYIDSQTLNAAKKMTSIDVNMSIAVEMLTHLCYETATQIDEGLDYFKREDFNVDGKTVMDGQDPMYNFFRERILSYRKNKRERMYL